MDAADQNMLVRTLHSPDFDEESDVFLKNMMTEGVDQLKVLNLLVPFITSEDGLKNLIYLFVRRTSDILDSVLKDVSLSKEALQIVKHFWALCFNQRDQLRQNQIPKSNGDLQFIDVLPSLASVYMDLAISTYCSKEKLKKVSSKLYSSLTFDLNPRCLKTALLEVSLCSAHGAQLLMPLLRKLLLSPPETKTPMDFLLHIVALRRWTLVSDTLMQELQDKRPVRAPANFVDWLSERWPGAMDYFPLDKSLKGSRITEVLMSLGQPAVEELIDVFSQCLLSNQTEVTALATEVAMETDQTEQLFVIDKRGTDTMVDPGTTSSKKRKRVLSVSEQDNHQLSNSDAESPVSIDNKRKKRKKGDVAESEFSQFYRFDSQGVMPDSMRKGTKKKVKVQRNEFIDLSDAEEEDTVDMEEGGSEEGEDDEREDGSESEEDKEDEEEEEDDDNNREDGAEGDAEDDEADDGGDDGSDVPGRGDEEDPNQRNNDDGDEKNTNVIMGTDKYAIYKYNKQSAPMEFPSKGTLSDEEQSKEKNKKQSEPKVKRVDGMKMTVYTAYPVLEKRSEKTIKRMKEFEEFLAHEDRQVAREQATRNPVEDTVSQTLRVIRDSVKGEAKWFKRHRPWLESDSASGNAAITGKDARRKKNRDIDEREIQEVVTEPETSGSLSHWLRSPSKTSATDGSPKTKVTSDGDESLSNPKKRQSRKSAADFFQDSNEEPASTSMVSPRKKSRSPSKSTEHDSSTDSPRLLKKSRKQSGSNDPVPMTSESVLPTKSEEISPAKSPSKAEKQQKKSPTKSASDLPQNSSKSPSKVEQSLNSPKIKQPSTPLATDNKTKSPEIKLPKSVLKTPETSSKAENPVSRKKGSKGVQSGGKQQSGGMLRRTYYLRNLTEPPPEEQPKDRDDGANNEDSSTPFTALKKKRTKSEPTGSPQKSPVNRRKSLRSASIKAK